MKTLILVGSGDTISHSYGLGKAIGDHLVELGAEIETINLIDSGLPLYDRSIERAKAHDNKTKTFLDKSYAADAFVWVTPIYHNSFSSTLKNALDWQHTKFPGKVVGLASNGGNRSPQALDQLMVVARAQHLITARVRVSTQEDDYDKSLNLSNPNMIARVKEFSEELVSLTRKINP